MITWNGARSAAKKRKNQHSLLRKNFIYTFFEVDARYVALAALTELAKIGKLEWSVVQGAMQDFGIKDDKKNPLLV